MAENSLIPQARINNLITTLQTLQGNIDNIELDLDDLHQTITEEIGQAITDLQGLISDETTRAQGVEGTLSNLTTTNKSNLVSAVNELNSNKVDKTSSASKVYGTDANGNQTTYNKDSFGQVDDVKVGTTSVVSNKIATLGTMAGETASDYATTTALNNKIKVVTSLPSNPDSTTLYCIPE